MANLYISLKPEDIRPEYNEIEGIGYKKLRLVCGQDEKMEQKLAFESCGSFYPNFVIYDIAMRKFIKEKFDVEIESPVKKWTRLCWKCFKTSETLKACSKCYVAKYCSKECQVQDWKVHKELHAMSKKGYFWH